MLRELRFMDGKVVQRIDGALKLINKISEVVDGLSFEMFINDYKTIDCTSFELIQLGEKMIKLEQLLRDRYPELPWSQSRKMRNIIVHDYENANPFIIYDTATKDVPILKHYFLKIKDDIKRISENLLQTKRLLLRPWDDDDANALFLLAKNEEIAKLCGWEPHKSIGDTLFALHNFLEIKESYAICLKENGTIIGSINLSFDSKLINRPSECELGFWIGENYQRNGYAYEACLEVLRHAFVDLKLTKIWCSYIDGNNKSKNLQNKLGFSFCFDCKKTSANVSENEYAYHVNSLTKKEWENSQNKIQI